MNLLFLSEENLKDSYFIKDLVFNMPHGQKILILHDHFPGRLNDTRFVTKRFSAMLSEGMVYNHAFSGDQRRIFSVANAELTVATDYLHQLFLTAPVIVLNPIHAGAEGAVAGNAIETARRLQLFMPVEQTFVFTRNHQSPLAASKPTLQSVDDYSRLLGLYEEEKTALDHALSLAPAHIASPVNFAK